MTTPVDMKGYSFHVGCKIVRAVGGNTPCLEICTVTEIKNGSIYLDGRTQPIRFPKRLLIIEQDPLYKMVKNHDSGNS